MWPPLRQSGRRPKAPANGAHRSLGAGGRSPLLRRGLSHVKVARVQANPPQAKAYFGIEEVSSLDFGRAAV